MMFDDKRWQQHLREQLLQRSKDDAQIQRRWEKYARERRFWPSHAATRAATKPEQITK